MAYLEPAQLADLPGRKEFNAFRGAPAGGLALAGLQLNGAQLFIRNFASPDTPYQRLLINWQTGTGKSIAAIAIAQEFVQQFRQRAALGGAAPDRCTVYVISFTARDTIQEDMLRYPEFGFVSRAESESLQRGRAAAALAGPASEVARRLATTTGALRRRITDRSRGGYYQFYGYKEFANQIFAVTARGAAAKFDVAALAEPGAAFGDRLRAAVARGDVTVNTDLLAAMRGGLLICDEIHNVYNIQESNNYGLAIQYALDALGAEAPRAVFMSATPMTGSAAEVVDLLNLLVPRAALPDGLPLRREDFFRTKHGEPSQLAPRALERIAQLSSGRVSFLLDADTASYPRRIFVGESVPAVPYLKITLCPMSPMHARTLAKAMSDSGADAEPEPEPEPEPEGGLSAATYTLYDMVFPNPEYAPDDADAVGLYRSRETMPALARAPEAWRLAAGVVIEPSPTGAPGEQLATGNFLGPDALPKYSAKYAALAAATVAALRSGPGKIMIYHHRVRMSGVLLIQEILRMHGIADETSMATDATLCAVCGRARHEHLAPGADRASQTANGAAGSAGAQGACNDYSPARFVVAHSDIDRKIMRASIARYNSTANLEGRLYRVLIGSRVVREGLNFRAVRWQLIASLPTDYPTSLQVIGRVIRKNSHNDLPPDQRDVRIQIFVTAPSGSSSSPELRRYVDKGREFLVIQEVERALRTNAVDGFANWGLIQAALGWTGENPTATIDALPYEPLQQFFERPVTRTATFDAYGHGDREVSVAREMCLALFRTQPAWTHADLWAAVRGGAVNSSYDPARFDAGNFALALESLARNGFIRQVSDAFGPAADALYVSTPDGAAPDVDTYLRPDSGQPANVQVSLTKYLSGARAALSLSAALQAFGLKYLAGDRALEFSLLECPPEVHYEILRQLVEGAAVFDIAGDARLSDMYRRFRIGITAAAGEAAPRVYRAPAARRPPDALVGFVRPDQVGLYDGAWYSAPLSEFGIGRRYQENGIVVGFTARHSDGTMRFKLRPPLQSGRGEKDQRTLERGAVCETRGRAELHKYLGQLRAALARTAGPSFAAANDRAATKRFPSTGEMCHTIRIYMLDLEAQARAAPDGLRWLYLFTDHLPT